MNIMLHHQALLKAPFFSQATGDAQFSAASGTQLHRYFEPEFVNQFQQDLQRGRLNDSESYHWLKEDAFSGFDNKPVLRLPMHKSFYVMSCEIVCERPGQPALDPQQIASAGFVIRRLGKNGEQSWMLEDDKALGWQSTPTGMRDPDINRRCCSHNQFDKNKIKLRGAKTTAANQTPVLTYTGEQTFPLHPVKTFDANGKCHTILFGYVPLSGTYMLRQSSSSTAQPFTHNFANDSLDQFKQAIATQLPWPFGFKKLPGQTSLDQSWTTACVKPIHNAYPTSAFFELLKHLINRYHLGEEGIELNEQLKAWAERQHFYVEIKPNGTPNGLSPATFSDLTRNDFINYRRPGNLYSWLKDEYATLVSYAAKQEKRVDANLSLEPVPNLGHYALYITPADAQELRNLLDQRALNHVVGKVKEIPLPKFGQTREDVYQITPFVRLRNACGGEDIIWGNAQTRSQIFRVAAPFDPNASRPSLIQMPSLADLRKGLAQGVSMITPPDTFSLLNALNLKKGASEDVVPSDVPQLGIQWICSFSLPVITLVAMILLMIMISLLNILFFWLPWVRICLPFPTIKKE
jgi:hypothetical protein